MKDVSVDAETRRVRVGAGARWADVDQATQPHGLALCGGTVSTVGVAGFTLGGGFGHLTRKHGLAIDNLLSAEVVTSTGEIVRASESENADLFWALRGGRGNFGIVTRFEFEAHPVRSEVQAGQIIYPFDDVETVLEAYRDFAFGAPEELTCYAFIIRVPPIPEIPEEHHGKVAIDLVVVHVGDPAEGEELIAPLRSLGTPIFEHVGMQPFLEVQKTFDAGVPVGLRWYTRAHDFDELSDDALSVVAKHTRDMPGATTMVYFSPGGGALSRVASTATAFSSRRARYSLHILCGWSDECDDAENMRWVRAFHEDMTPHARGSVYVNLLGEDEQQRVPEAYGVNYTRLRRLKASWDPQNLFRRTHVIPPA
jgi:FAD/FMN-containing dehydrogenase